jgi:uncharacterized C2H2 Zn-finger protein
LTTKQAIHQCPDCSRTFVSRTGLGSHRRSAHGIIGQSKTTLIARKKAGAKKPKPITLYLQRKQMLKEMKAPENPAPFQCGFCGFQLKNQAGLTFHVKTFHAQPAAPAAPTQAEDHSLQCPHCEFVGKLKGGLALHIRKKHNESTRRAIEPRKTQTITIAATHNGHKEDWQGHTDGIPEALIAVTSGRFQELCRSVAYEHDLPPRLFASRVAAFVYGTTLR